MKKIRMWLVLLLAASCLAATLSGCGNKNASTAQPAAALDEREESSLQEEDSRTPEEHFSDFLAQTLNEQKEDPSDGAALEAAILERMTYEEVTNRDGTVTLTITAPDMKAVLTDTEETNLLFLGDGLTRARQKLETGNFQTISSVVTVKLNENGVPEEPYALYDAMYGGLLSAMEELIVTMGEE